MDHLIQYYTHLFDKLGAGMFKLVDSTKRYLEESGKSGRQIQVPEIVIESIITPHFYYGVLVMDDEQEILDCNKRDCFSCYYLSCALYQLYPDHSDTPQTPV